MHQKKDEKSAETFVPHNYCDYAGCYAYHWTEVTKEMNERWSNEWKDVPEPEMITREKYNQIKNNLFND